VDGITKTIRRLKKAEFISITGEIHVEQVYACLTVRIENRTTATCIDVTMFFVGLFYILDESAPA